MFIKIGSTVSFLHFYAPNRISLSLYVRFSEIILYEIDLHEKTKNDKIFIFSFYLRDVHQLYTDG